MELEELIIKLTDNYTKIIDIEIIKNNQKLYWGGNGVGNRWLNKKYNYSVIYSNKKIKNYSENITPTEKINGTRLFIFIHSKTMF